MAETVFDELSDELIQFLQGEKLVFVTTVSADGGIPHVAAVTWLMALNSKVIRLGIDPRAQSVANIHNNPIVAVTVPGPTSCWTVNGRARVGQAQLPGVSLRMVMVEIEIESIRDIMFYGGRLTETMKYEKTYDPKLIVKFDQEVFEALRSAPFE